MKDLSLRWIGMDVDIVTSLGRLPCEQLEVLYIIGFATDTSEVLS